MTTNNPEITENDIKKVLYKENPMAGLVRPFIPLREDGKTYRKWTAQCSLGRVEFHVFDGDPGTENFEANIPAKLLIRWLERLVVPTSPGQN